MIYPVLGTLLGIVAGCFFPYTMTAGNSLYVAIAIFAAFDSMLGGTVAMLTKKFVMPVFLSGFFGNALLAVLIVFLGTKLGLDLYIAVAVVFGFRIFQNFAILRRFLLNKYKKDGKIEKRDLSES